MDAGRNAIRSSLFADGGERNELCELQSAARGRRRTADIAGDVV